MPTERLDVDVIVEAITKGFDKTARDLDKVGNEAEDMGRKTARSAGGVSTMNVALGNLAAGGLATAGRALFQFGKDSITAASDVEEMESKFIAVFKDMAGDTEKELAKMADTINRSKFDLMEYAATLQDTFVPLGFARDAAAGMSVKLVALAEDLASFNNIDTATVVRDLQSALVGNTETLRKYGVVAQQTQINARALADGLWDGKGAMDAQTKAATILTLTIEGTEDAQGDAAKTADSFANKQKGLEASMKDAQVAIGELFLPAMAELVDFATTAVTAIVELIEETKKYGLEVGETIDDNLGAAESLGDLADESDRLNDMLGGFAGLRTATKGAMDEITEGGRRIAEQVALQTSGYEDFDLILRDMFDDKLMENFETFVRWQGLTVEEFFNMVRAAKELEQQTERTEKDMETWRQTQIKTNEALTETDLLLQAISHTMEDTSPVDDYQAALEGIEEMTFTEIATQLQTNITAKLGEAEFASGKLADAVEEDFARFRGAVEDTKNALMG